MWLVMKRLIGKLLQRRRNIRFYRGAADHLNLSAGDSFYLTGPDRGSHAVLD